MPDNQTREALAAQVDRLREERAVEIELLRQERAAELTQSVDTVAINASKAREELASKLAFTAGQEAARIDGRLTNLDSAVIRINGSIEKTATALEKLGTDMNKRFQDQMTVTESSRVEARKLLLQIFGAVLVATIGAAATIIVALISSGPS